MSDNSTPRTRRLSFWLLLFSVSFLVSLGLCGISLKTTDEVGRLAVLSVIGMALSIAGFLLALFIAVLWALVGATKR